MRTLLGVLLVACWGIGVIVAVTFVYVHLGDVFGIAAIVVLGGVPAIAWVEWKGRQPHAG